MKILCDKILLEPREKMYFKDCNEHSELKVIEHLWSVFRVQNRPSKIQDIKNALDVNDESRINAWLEVNGNNPNRRIIE